VIVTGNEDDNINTAAARLTDAMSGPLRAIDAMTDEGVAVRDVPEELPEVGRLGARLSAVRGSSD
jgi:hypothetical protein